MFDSKQFLSGETYRKITELRVSDPLYSRRAAERRLRRGVLTTDGRLSIMAADHPARRVTKAGGDALAMADRHDYLARVLRVLMAPGVDGVMATMDVLEDLLTLNELAREAGDVPPADGKLLMASMNRGGLLGASWEMDDPLTGPTAAACAEWQLDGVKLLLRVCDDDAGSLKTLTACAAAISDANRFSLPTFLEPLPVERGEGGFKVVKTAEALTPLVGVASALGSSSHRLWLKLPYCEGYGRVAGATSLPILLLGGESAGDPVPFLRQISGAMAAAPNVRGAMVGRNVLYPGAGDPRVVAEAVGGIIHDGWDLAKAQEHLGR